MSAMKTQASAVGTEGSNPPFFDAFTKWALGIMIGLLLCIYASGAYMSAHKLTGIGTDDVVNNQASAKHHPFVELPGDAEISAFSVGNFFAGLIVGYNWLKLFGTKPATKKED